MAADQSDAELLALCDRLDPHPARPPESTAHISVDTLRKLIAAARRSVEQRETIAKVKRCAEAAYARVRSIAWDGKSMLANEAEEWLSDALRAIVPPDAAGKEER